MRIRTTSGYAAIGFVSGVACGALLWTRMQHRYRKDLFNRRAIRRLAALSYLRARPSLSNTRLLREYVAWEKNPLLRQRGFAILGHVSATLD